MSDMTMLVAAVYYIGYTLSEAYAQHGKKL